MSHIIWRAESGRGTSERSAGYGSLITTPWRQTTMRRIPMRCLQTGVEPRRRQRNDRFRTAALLLMLIWSTIAGVPALADPNHEVDTPNWIALPLSSVDGFFPTAWTCGGAAPSPQAIVQFHQNWHCTNPDHTGSNWGNRFFGFHKQFLLGYDRYLTSVGEPHVQTWVAAPGALIP